MRVDHNALRTVVGFESQYDDAAYIFICDTMINVWGPNLLLAFKYEDGNPVRHQYNCVVSHYEPETDPVLLALWRNWTPYSAPDLLIDRILELFSFTEPAFARILAETDCGILEDGVA